MKGEKSKKVKRTFFRCVIPTALLAAVFVFTNVKAENQGRTYDETFVVGTGAEVRMSLNEPAPPEETFAGPFAAQRPFILLSASWDESTAEGITGVTVSVRTRVAENAPWSAWMELERLRDFRDDTDLTPGHVRTEPLVVEESQEFEARVTLTTLDPRVTPQISNLSFTTIGTEGQESREQGTVNSSVVRAALNDTEKLNIISRSSWASDESLRTAEDGTPAWPETYGEVKAFVIHHTGGTNGGSDPAATIRAIQRYHGKTLGWGDIGYNYLIAPDGRVYEGRAGGEGVVGGHTYNDKKKIGYNTGSIGIAILGNYEGRDTFTPAAQESLAKLIAEKSFEHEVTPNGETTLKDVSIPAVVSHKDIDSTICPGTGIVNELIEARRLARTKLDARGGLAAIQRKATLIQQSDTNILIKPGQTKTIWVSFRNDGNTNWKNYLLAPVQLADASIKGRIAALPSSVTAAFVSEPTPSSADPSVGGDLNPLLRGVPEGRGVSQGTVRIAQVMDDEIRPVETQAVPINALTFREPNVAPGQTVTIPITITVPPNAAGIIERDYVLAWGALGYFQGTDVHIAIETTEQEWTGKIESLETPHSAYMGRATQGIVRVRNRGIKTWLKGSIMLLLTDVAGGEPQWNVAGWPLPMGRILFNESMVRPNEVATFSLPLTATTPGVFETLLSFKYLPTVGTVPQTLIETLRLPNLPGAEGSFVTTVIPSVQIEFMNPRFPTRMRPGKTIYFTLHVKNTGATVLKGGKNHTRLTQTRSDGSPSPFYVSYDWIDKTHATALWETKVSPQKEGKFVWRMRAPLKKGTYTETLTLTTAEGAGLINGKPKYPFTIKVE